MPQKLITLIAFFENQVGPTFYFFLQVCMIRLIHCFLGITLILPIIAQHRSCIDLLPGQFLCGEEEINPETQLPKNCSKHHTYTLGRLSMDINDDNFTVLMSKTE